MNSTRRSKFLFSLLCLVGCLAPLRAQPDLAGAARVKLALEQVQVLGSVMMIAAHPDDENTAVLAYFARGRNLETAYLSLTRGEGGQNLIGSEQGARLGVIRTQELLAARRIDGAHQYFTRAIDFGFTKSADETMAKWGHDEVLGDVVWMIRRLRPDVIILRFSGTARDGHGQHQASALLGKEAFAAAADPARFPEQLQFVQPWRARRLVWNAFSFTAEQEKEAARLGGRISIDTGEYSPVLGYSYGEIAGMSRSMHRTQAMGSAERRGSMPQFFITVAGEPATRDILDGVDTTWNRLSGGRAVSDLLAQAERDFSAEHPEKSIPALAKARQIVAGIKDYWAVRKLPELDEAIALCAGVWLDAVTDRPAASPAASARITLTALDRGGVPARLRNVVWSGVAAAKPSAVTFDADLAPNVPLTRAAEWNLADSEQYTQPYWLRQSRTGELYNVADLQLRGLPENPPILAANFTLEIAGAPIVLTRPVVNRYVDRARGELLRPFTVVPKVAVSIPESALVFANGSPKHVEVPVRATGGSAKGSLRLDAAGLRIEPPSAAFSLSPGEQKVIAFTVAPPPGRRVETRLAAVAAVDGREISSGLDVIDYEHIPPQTLFPESSAKVVVAPIKTLAKNIGYVMGAGDQVPQSLEQIGCEVTLLAADDLARADLSRFDAIVTGVRAWNVRPDLRANRQRLLDYMQNGGALIVQYNVLEGGFGAGDSRSLEVIGPYPIRISRDRVTVEEAPVTFPNPASPLLAQPNTITEADFTGWVQERGLYFASEWDPRYQTLFASHDPGEKPLAGGTLTARYGKGAYVFTAYSWFRQLPAGVPGAYRIFANLLSAGKVLSDAR